MAVPVVVGSAFVAQYPSGGGNFWVPVQYLLGLREIGVDARWLELLWTGGDVELARGFIDAFRRSVERLGVAEWVTLVYFPAGTRDDPPGRAEHVMGLSAAELRARARDALLLNAGTAQRSVPIGTVWLNCNRRAGNADVGRSGARL